MGRKEVDQERHLKSLQVNPNISGAAVTSRQILLDAGFSPSIIREAVRQLSLALKSDKVRFAVSGGQVIDSIKVADTESRLKAAALVFTLAGVSKVEDTRAASVTVQIVNYNRGSAT